MLSFFPILFSEVQRLHLASTTRGLYHNFYWRKEFSKYLCQGNRCKTSNISKQNSTQTPPRKPQESQPVLSPSHVLFLSPSLSPRPHLAPVIPTCWILSEKSSNAPASWNGIPWAIYLSCPCHSIQVFIQISPIRESSPDATSQQKFSPYTM